MGGEYPVDEREQGYELAGWGVRLGAYLIDALIIGAVNAFVARLMGGGVTMQNGVPTANPTVQVVGIVIGAAYVIGFWLAKNGQTPGKMALGIQVLGADGTPISPGQAILRYIGYFVSGIICLLGFFWPLWDEENRAWHDMIAGTRVVRKR